MELRQLHYFRVIAEEQHFGRASQRLRIAQPALSRQVRLLEAELGVALFERLPRGVRLTSAGAILAQHCGALAAQIDQMVTQTRAAAAGSLGLLRLGFIEVAAWQGAVPATIRAFREAFPGVDLKLSALTSQAQRDALEAGELDAGFFYNPPPDERLVSHLIARHTILLALPADSPLAADGILAVEDLHGQDFVGFRREASPRLHDDLSAALARKGFEPRIVAESSSEADMLALVTTGSGIAFVNSCQQWRQPPGIRFATVGDLDVGLDLALVARRDNSSPALRHFLALTAARQ